MIEHANINTFASRLAAWHTLGKIIGKFMTYEELKELAELDYFVFKSQNFDGLGRKIPAWSTFKWKRADFLAKNKAASEWIGNVGEGYKVIQHAVGMQLIDQLVQSVDGAHYECGGSLGNGETVWALADLSLSTFIGSDEHKHFILFTTSHDGTVSFQLKLVDTRVVCQNTFTLALREKTIAQAKLKHTKNCEAKIEDMKAMLDGIKSEIATVGERLNFLARKKVTKETVTTIMDRLFPITKTTALGTTESSTRRNNILADILKCYELNDGNAFPEQRGTPYNLLNAVTEYTDHVRGSDLAGNKKRAESAMFGSGNDLKSKAFEVIYEVAQEMPDMKGMQVGKTTTVYTPASNAPASNAPASNAPASNAPATAAQTKQERSILDDVAKMGVGTKKKK